MPYTSPVSVEWGNAAEWISGLATVGALGFTGYQVWLLRKDRARDQEIELQGVAVAWRAKVVPHGPDANNEGVWIYEITANNPGRLPISNVQVVLTFPMKVSREHYDGHRGEPVHDLHLVAPVILGGRDRSWNRTVVLSYDQRLELPGTTAVVRYQDSTGRARQSTWPKAPVV
jgi:hypothetical protein